MLAGVLRDRRAAALWEYALIAAIIVATVAVGFISLSGVVPN
jgi:Flp pilus assembly pilin Flp